MTLVMPAAFSAHPSRTCLVPSWPTSLPGGVSAHLTSDNTPLPEPRVPFDVGR